MNARAELYAALMAGGPHSPDRSEKASALIDSFRRAELRSIADHIWHAVSDTSEYGRGARWAAGEIERIADQTLGGAV